MSIETVKVEDFSRIDHLLIKEANFGLLCCNNYPHSCLYSNLRVAINEADNHRAT